MTERQDISIFTLQIEAILQACLDDRNSAYRYHVKKSVNIYKQWNFNL